MAKNNIKFTGFIDDKAVKKLMEECRAFVYAGIEDFGIAPVEAMAAGAPVIAYGKAGILDTVNCITSASTNPTGLLYKNQSYETLRDCVNYFEEKKMWKNFSGETLNNWSQKFSKDNFKKKFTSYIDEYLSQINF